MKVKLDENLGALGAGILKAAGVDVITVADQNLLSTPDGDLARICAASLIESVSTSSESTESNARS